MLKKNIILIWRKKYKINKRIKNNYLATRSYRKLKHCWHKIQYYRNPEVSCKLSKTIRQDKNVLGYVLAKNTIDLLTQSKDFKFVTTTVLVFIKTESDNKTKYDTFYSQSKAEALINECDIENIFQSIYSTVQTGLLIQS